MSKDTAEYKGDGIPRAYVSLGGQLLECNADFLEITGLSERDIPHTSLTSLAKYKSPEGILESAYLLDQLADSKDSEWRADLGVGKEMKKEDYQITAKVSDVKLHGQTVLEAIVQPAHSAAQPKLTVPRFTKMQSEEITNFIPQKVLLVEDSPASLKVMVRTVERMGHIVTTAVNGQEALDKFRSADFDIVLMDINMPIMNGLESADKMREYERSRSSPGRLYVKIIAISADISNTLFHEVTNAGFDTFVPKPLTAESFKDILKLPARTFNHRDSVRR